jgi:hypothetical protein
MELISNKKVNIKELKATLGKSYPLGVFNNLQQVGEATGSREIINRCIDLFVQELIERPAYISAGLDPLKHSIYEAIDNVDQFRDTVNDFINMHLHYIQKLSETLEMLKHRSKPI